MSRTEVFFLEEECPAGRTWDIQSVGYQSSVDAGPMASHVLRMCPCPCREPDVVVGLFGGANFSESYASAARGG